MIKAKKKNETVYYRGFDEQGNESRGCPAFTGKGTFIIDKSLCIPVKIDRTTLCSWTGKNDCNGNPVFEGDIVRRKYEDRVTGENKYEDYLVQWDREKAGFCMSTPLTYYEETLYRTPGYEVVGNVYKNPELAKQFDGVRRGI